MGAAAFRAGSVACLAPLTVTLALAIEGCGSSSTRSTVVAAPAAHPSSRSAHPSSRSARRIVAGGATGVSGAVQRARQPRARSHSGTAPSGSSSGGIASAGSLPAGTVPAGTASTATPTPGAPTLAGKVITLDPGHNGGNFGDPAAINRLVWDGNGYKPCDTSGTAAPDGYRETDFNWEVALDTRLDLIREGATVVLTRHNNTGIGPCVNERAAIGNRAHSAAAISIHADGGPPSGSGFAILTPAPIASHYNQQIIAPSGRLALALRSTLLAIGLHESNYDGVAGIAPRTDLGGLNLSLVPKVFIEVGNMQNPADEAPMQTSSYRRRVAAALAAGITLFLLHH